MATPAARLRLRRASALALLLFALTALAALGYAGSESALRWLAAQLVERSAGRLRLDEVGGSLYGPLRIGRFAWADGGTRAEGEGLELDWSPRALLLRHTLLLGRVKLRALAVHAGKGSAAPLQLPPSLRLPLRVEIPSARIDTLALAFDGSRYELHALAFALRNPSGRWRASASAETPWGKSEAEIELADTAPYALDGSAGLAGSYGAHAYAVQGTLAGTLADVAVSARADAAGAQAELRAALAPFAATPLKQASLQLARVDAQRFAAALPRTEVTAKIELRAEGNAYAGAVELANALPGTLDAKLVPLHALQLSFAGVPGSLRLHDLDLDLGAAGRLRGDGSLREGRLRLALRAQALDLHGLHPRLNATALAGAIDVQAQAKMQALQADLRQKGYRLRLDAARRGDALQIRSAQLAAAGGELEFSGEISLAAAHAFRATGKLRHFDPSRLGDYPAAALNASISASGQLSPKPEAALAFSTTDSSYRGHRLRGSGNARVAAGRIWDSELRLDLGANHLAARGAFGARGDVLDWQLDARELAAVAAHLGGQLRASGRLLGGMDEPAGTFRAHGSDLIWAGGHRIADFSADGKMEQGIDGPLALDARLSGYRSPTLQIEAASAAATGRRSAHQLELTLRGGALDARAALAGGWHAGKGWSGRILSFDNRGAYAAQLEAPATLALANGDFSLGAATLRFARGSVHIAELARRAQGIYSAGTLTGIDAGYLLGLLPRAPEIAGTLRLGGSWKLAAADKLDGTLALHRERGDLRLLAEPATALGLQQLALDATISADRVSAKLDARGAVFGQVSANLHTALARRGGTLGLADDMPLSLDGAIDMPSLAWVDALVGAKMALRGRLKGQFSAQGTLAQPQLAGTIDGDALEFDYPEQGAYLKDGSLRAHLQDNRLVLDRLLLHGGAGSLEAGGALIWAADKLSAQVALSADKLEVLKRLDRNLVLSGSAQANLQGRRLRLSAKLKADAGEIALPDADTPTLSSDVVVLGRDEQAPREAAPFATELDLDLDLGEHFRLKGRGIDARLAGAVKVQAASGAPASASGSIRVAAGSYSAYGQRLVIERGILNFSGPLDNPGLDILALRKGLPVEAGVAIRGTALAPDVSLYSNPSVPDSEKLSWLVLGHGMEGANRSDLGLLQSAAGALLARGESISLQQRIAHAAGLDEFSLSGGGALESSVLTLGKRLSSRAYLSFEQGLASASNLVKITYTLTPRLSLRAQTGSESALDAFYTFSFK